MPCPTFLLYPCILAETLNVKEWTAVLRHYDWSPSNNLDDLNAVTSTLCIWFSVGSVYMFLSQTVSHYFYSSPLLKVSLPDLQMQTLSWECAVIVDWFCHTVSHMFCFATEDTCLCYTGPQIPWEVDEWVEKQLCGTLSETCAVYSSQLDVTASRRVMNLMFSACCSLLHYMYFSNYYCGCLSVGQKYL